MKVAVISFFESNSRYYHYLEQALKKEITDAEIIHLCLYPSSVKYCKKHKLNYIYLTKEVRQESPYSKINLDKYLKYHYEILPKYIKEIKRIGGQYYNFFCNFFNKYHIDILICIGDERLYASIPSKIAKDKGVKVLYFEPGPFSTMIFDKQGVNCRMEISNISREKIKSINVNKEILKEFYDTSDSKVKFYHQDKMAYIRKINDILYTTPPSFVRRYLPIELQTGEGFIESIIYLWKRILQQRKNNISKDINEYGKYIFVPLQVPTDVQLIIHSPLYKDFYTMLKDIYNAKPNGYNVVVREHPMNIGRYDKKVYKFIKTNNGIFLDNETPIQDLIKNSELVVINNSTVGVEALRYGKTVIALGKTYYSQVVYNVKNKAELSTVIKKALNERISEDIIEKYLYLLYKDYLIKDHYKNLKYKNLGSVINLLKKQMLS